MAKKNVKALEDSLARARAELMERILKKLNQGATFREIEAIYEVSYHEIRQYLSTWRVHLTVEESNFLREVAEHFGMLPNEAFVLFAIECAKKAYAELPGTPDSPLTAKRRRTVIDNVYDRVVGKRGDLYCYPRPVPPAQDPPKKTASAKKPKASTAKKKAAKSKK